mgnify:CR=1 FL=1|jgi:hypothetical protein
MKSNIWIVFFSLFIAQSLFAIRFGMKIPWGGDEWFSYKNLTVMAYPFSLIVSLFKEIIGELNSQNYIFYRQQGLLWSFLVYLFLYLVNIKSKDIYLSHLALFLAFFFSVNPYFLETSQFFRYYQLYIFASVVFTFGIIKYDYEFSQKRIWFYIFMIISFFIHLFLFIQLFIYIILKEAAFLKKQTIIIVLVLTIISLSIVIPNLPAILSWSWNTLFPMYSFDYPEIHRGYSLSTLLKPFIIVYTFMFSRKIHPFSYPFLDLCFIIVGIGIIYGIFLILRGNGKLKTPLLFSVLSPLFVSILIIEPISLPMMTQISPQHIIFLFPWLGIIVYQLLNKSIVGKSITILFFTGLLYGSIIQQKLEFVDWTQIQQVVGSENVPVISDAPGTCEFFLKNKGTWFQYIDKVENIITAHDTISLTMTNWKYYQIIDSLQFWHNPKGSKDEYQSKKRILKLLKNNNFSLINGYSFFPIHSYTFAKNQNIRNLEPWFYDLKYQDLKLPLIIGNDKIIGFEKVEFGEEITIDSTCYYFIQTTNPVKDIPVIQIINGDGTKMIYKMDTESDTYRSYFCRSINDDDIVYKYKKKPLVSNSMKYPGSVFNSEGRIYKFENMEKGFMIKPLDSSVTIFIAFLDKS